MSLTSDLLEQAMHLATREAVGPPKQASLRRAVSAAYYATFHLLAISSANVCAPSDPPALRLRVQRALEHATMKEACQRVVKATTLPPIYAALLSPATTHSAQLVRVAQTFVALQDARHAADYDLQRKFSRAQVLQLLTQANLAATEWNVVRATAEANVFLADLYFGKRWSR